MIRLNKAIKALFRINCSLFPILILAGFTTIGVETFKYPGFLGRHLIIGSGLLFNLTFLSGVLVLLSYGQIVGGNLVGILYNKMFKFNLLFFPLVLIVWWSLNDIETHTFPGYIFSILHIHPQNLIGSAVLSTFVLFVQIYFYLADT